jgi:hypothetical protein
MPEDAQPTKDAEPTTNPVPKPAEPADAKLSELEAAVARNPADGARALAKALDLGCDEPWAWYESGLVAATRGDRVLLEKARDALRQKDAELARKLDARVRELGATSAEAGHCAAPAPAEAPAEDAEAASC